MFKELNHSYMTPDKSTEMLMHLMINMQSEFLAFRGLFIDTIVTDEEGDQDEDYKKEILDKLKEDATYYQKALVASVRNRYDTTLGSPTDFLYDLFPTENPPQNDEE